MLEDGAFQFNVNNVFNFFAFIIKLKDQNAFNTFGDSAETPSSAMEKPSGVSDLKVEGEITAVWRIQI